MFCFFFAVKCASPLLNLQTPWTRVHDLRKKVLFANFDGLGVRDEKSSHLTAALSESITITNLWTKKIFYLSFSYSGSSFWNMPIVTPFLNSSSSEDRAAPLSLMLFTKVNFQKQWKTKNCFFGFCSYRASRFESIPNFSEMKQQHLHHIDTERHNLWFFLLRKQKKQNKNKITAKQKLERTTKKKNPFSHPLKSTASCSSDSAESFDLPRLAKRGVNPVCFTLLSKSVRFLSELTSWDKKMGPNNDADFKIWSETEKKNRRTTNLHLRETTANALQVRLQWWENWARIRWWRRSPTEATPATNERTEFEWLTTWSWWPKSNAETNREWEAAPKALAETISSNPQSANASTFPAWSPKRQAPSPVQQELSREELQINRKRTSFFASSSSAFAGGTRKMPFVFTPTAPFARRCSHIFSKNTGTLALSDWEKEVKKETFLAFCLNFTNGNQGSRLWSSCKDWHSHFSRLQNVVLQRKGGEGMMRRHFFLVLLLLLTKDPISCSMDPFFNSGDEDRRTIGALRGDAIIGIGSGTTFNVTVASSFASRIDICTVSSSIFPCASSSSLCNNTTSSSW